MILQELNKVWGKFDVESGRKQPLVAHLTDVAAVFEQIMDGALFQRHFQRVLGRPLSETLRERLCVLALWHDYGKISPKFYINQMIISKNPQFTGISARQQLEFTTHLLLTD